MIGVRHVGARVPGPADRQVELGAELARHGFVSLEAVLLGCVDRPIVEIYRLSLMSGDARDLGLHEQALVLVVVRAELRPEVEVDLVRPEHRHMLLFLGDRRGVIQGDQRQAAVKDAPGDPEHVWQIRRRLQREIDERSGSLVVPVDVGQLQFEDVIVGEHRHEGRLGFERPHEGGLVEGAVAPAVAIDRASPQVRDDLLRSDQADHGDLLVGPLHEGEILVDLFVDGLQVVSEVDFRGDHVITCIREEYEVSGLESDLAGARKSADHHPERLEEVKHGGE